VKEKMNKEFTPRGNYHGFHKSLYFEAMDIICHSCDHNGACDVNHKCKTMKKILAILFPRLDELRRE